jgi:hypothetical protein
MSKINDFVKGSKNKELDRLEKLYGNYGCKYCKEDSDIAYWDRSSSKIIWICSEGHRSEMQFD